MPKSLKTNDLINSVKRRAMIPASQNTFKTDDFLEILNEEMAINLLPIVLGNHEDYYLISEDVPLVTNQKQYSIPYRAIAASIKDVHIRDTSGNMYELTRIDSGMITDYQNDYGILGTNEAFYTEGDTIVLVNGGAGFGGASLVFSYYIQPNNLVEDKYGATIQSVTVGATQTTLVLDSVPTAFSESGAKFDFISHRSPHSILCYDLTPVSINTTTLVFNNDDLNGRLTETVQTGDIPIRLQAGDFITIAGETIVPNLPVEVHPVLAQLAAVYCLESLNDLDGLDRARQKLALMQQNTNELLHDRVENAPKKIVNRHGALRTVLGRRNYRY